MADDEPEMGMEPKEFRRMRKAEGDNSIEQARANSPAAERNLSHGLYAAQFGFMRCEQCRLKGAECELYQEGGDCQPERAWMEERLPQLEEAMRQVGRDPDLHVAQVVAAVHSEIRYMRNWRIVNMEGEVRPDPKTGLLVETPSSGRVERMRGAMDRAWGELGLSPSALAQLAAERERGLQGGQALLRAILAGSLPGTANGGGERREAGSGRRQTADGDDASPPAALPDGEGSTDGETGELRSNSEAAAPKGQTQEDGGE